MKFRFRRPAVPSTFEVNGVHDIHNFIVMLFLTIGQQEQTGTQYIATECASLVFQLLHSFRQAGKYIGKDVGNDGDHSLFYKSHFRTLRQKVMLR